DGPSVRRLDSFSGTDGRLLFDAVRQQGQEGVVAKRLASRYQPGKRSKDWLKVKAVRTQSCVIVGYTPPQGGRKHFGSLAVGVVVKGRLTYAGQAGSGFDEATLGAIIAAIEPLADRNPPAVGRAEMAPREITWVTPALVCEVKYTEFTREGVLRHPTFLGMRPDKVLEDCAREDSPG
ncbi:MAG: hypothetical protein M3010_13190, partial [Candidatus Dormibacteraeota bacterium]|nr:hypothetical protein [Candidatus Dormibacteraeota bacterium]